MPTYAHYCTIIVPTASRDELAAAFTAATDGARIAAALALESVSSLSPDGNPPETHVSATLMVTDVERACVAQVCADNPAYEATYYAWANARKGKLNMTNSTSAQASVGVAAWGIAQSLTDAGLTNVASLESRQAGGI